MEQIEFQATIEENGTISLPESIGKKIKPGRVHVILVDAEPRIFDREETHDRERDRAWDYIEYLMENPIKIDKSIPFLSREEIYDRR